MMKIFKIHTEENGKDVDYGVYGVSTEIEDFDEEDATAEAVEEIEADLRSMRYRTVVQRYNEFTLIHVWYDDNDGESHKIMVWASLIYE